MAPSVFTLDCSLWSLFSGAAQKLGLAESSSFTHQHPTGSCVSARESVYLERGVRQRQAACDGLVLRPQELAWKAGRLPSLCACALALRPPYWALQEAWSFPRAAQPHPGGLAPRESTLHLREWGFLVHDSVLTYGSRVSLPSPMTLTPCCRPFQSFR